MTTNQDFRWPPLGFNGQESAPSHQNSMAGHRKLLETNKYKVHASRHLHNPVSSASLPVGLDEAKEARAGLLFLNPKMTTWHSIRHHHGHEVNVGKDDDDKEPEDDFERSQQGDPAEDSVSRQEADERESIAVG